jgi:hypothetical protein
MKNERPPVEPILLLNRRGALRNALAALAAAPWMLPEAPAVASETEASFAPENDYPYFGYEPDSFP